MKQITCAAMGGPETCTTMISGNNAEEMISNGWKHIQEAHPDMAAKIGANSKEENDKWMADFKAKFDTFPEA